LRLAIDRLPSGNCRARLAPALEDGLRPVAEPFLLVEAIEQDRTELHRRLAGIGRHGDDGGALVCRGLTRCVVPLNLLRFRDVAICTQHPELAPAEPVSGG